MIVACLFGAVAAGLVFGVLTVRRWSPPHWLHLNSVPGVVFVVVVIGLGMWFGSESGAIVSLLGVIGGTVPPVAVAARRARLASIPD